MAGLTTKLVANALGPLLVKVTALPPALSEPVRSIPPVSAVLRALVTFSVLARFPVTIASLVPLQMCDYANISAEVFPVLKISTKSPVAKVRLTDEAAKRSYLRQNALVYGIHSQLAWGKRPFATRSDRSTDLPWLTTGATRTRQGVARCNLPRGPGRPPLA